MSALEERIEKAAARSGIVLAASGRLAAFNDAGILSPVDVHAATVIARLYGETDEQVILAAALVVRGSRFGHVCIRLDQQRDIATAEGQESDLSEELWPDPEKWLKALQQSRMVGDGLGPEPLVLTGGRLYSERYFRYEQQLVELIQGRCSNGYGILEPELRESLGRIFPPVENGVVNPQHQAAVRSLSGPLTVLAGGPGTGKTYVLGRMLVALAEQSHPPFPRVALCAPTGKAAARLGEEVAQAASLIQSELVQQRLSTISRGTIHRLLGWTWRRGRFRRNARNRLPHDLVIVDEMSMVSLPLAAKLLSAVRDDASVVLVGDPFQLESIEVGTVLADIVGPAVDLSYQRVEKTKSRIGTRVVVLDKVHRHDERGMINAFAQAVKKGDADQGVRFLQAGDEALTWVPDTSSEAFEREMQRLIEHRSRLVEQARSTDSPAAVLSSLEELAVLAANREGEGSVAEWQRSIEAALDERFAGLRYGGEWYPGRPVMITSNDYRLELFNGDIGLTIQTEDGLRVVFGPEPVRAFPPTYLGEHSTVHALTIHKSQGSQFKNVVVSLPSTESRLLTRQLLYTAVTRASDKVTIIGSETALRLGIERSARRASGLGTRLWVEHDHVTA
ncbi:MAG: exodeoxyribonuclease V subunit alpha [bacterium]|nr:exodeoxyribonuclease V subunit alpha [bacterium]